jgi:hypothetical protein
MPNYCSNHVAIKGDGKLINKIKESVEVEELFITFCPEEEWETKWEGFEYSITHTDEDSIEMFFMTAWSPPLGVYSKLVEMGVDVVGMYYEPGMAFAGIWDNGSDCQYDLPDTAEEIRKSLPEELDDAFSISDSVEEWESDFYEGEEDV